MMRHRLVLMIAPLTLTLLLAILTVGCLMFGPSAQELSNQTAIAGLQASLSALNAGHTATVDAAGRQTSIAQAASTATVLLATQASQATATARAVQSATAASIATATAQPALAEANAPGGWKLALFDGFDDNHNDWPVGSDDTNQWVHKDSSIGDGLYSVKTIAKQGFSYYMYPSEASNVTDFYATVDGKLGGGDSASAYGLVFDLVSYTGDFYVFAINEQGFWGISVHKSGHWADVKYGKSGQIVTGGNHLAVKGVGHDFTVYVNNEQVAQAHDDRLDANGKVGLMVEGNFGGAESTITFDNFIVLTPP